jgi:hypothetical protein
MRFLVRAHQVPIRLTVGAFILNSGLSKLQALDEAADATHGMAKTAYPFLESQDARTFTRNLGRAELALGSALLAPFVPSLVAGAALTAFSAGLAGLYLRIPGMRQEGGIRPTQQGIALAKDTWLVGAGASLVLDELTRPRGDRRRRRCA